MARLWLVLLLALALRPSEAAASAGAPPGEADEIHAHDADYGSGALRSSSPLGLVLGLATPGSWTGGGRGLHLRAGSELRLAHARPLVGPGSDDTDGAGTPLCEHLPYHATAPPSLR